MKLAEVRSSIINELEDYAYGHVHAFTKILREHEYLTDEQIMEALHKFDESLQAPNPGQ
jgi:hypothetical protein